VSIEETIIHPPTIEEEIIQQAARVLKPPPRRPVKTEEFSDCAEPNA
jgi:hypothetical protein